MKSVVVAAVIGLYVFVFVVTGVPSRLMYGSEARYFVVFLGVYGITAFFAARALISWRKFEPMRAPWAGVEGNPLHQYFSLLVAAFVVLVVFTCLQAFLAEESNPLGPMVSSPCGASSCTSAEAVALTYNPNGFFGGSGLQYTDLRPTVCLYKTCAWADGNGLPIAGYAPEPNATGYPDLSVPCSAPTCLATNRTQDYPNWATGIAGGFTPGFGESNIGMATTCPGTYVDITPEGTFLRGRKTCAYVIPYLTKHYAYSDPATAYCPLSYPDFPGAADDVVWGGFFCPGLSETSTPEAMLKQFVYSVDATIAPLLLWIVVHNAAHTKRTCKRRAQPKKL